MSRFQVEAVVLGLEPSLVCCVCCFKILCVVGLPPGGWGGETRGGMGRGRVIFHGIDLPGYRAMEWLLVYKLNNFLNCPSGIKYEWFPGDHR